MTHDRQEELPHQAVRELRHPVPAETGARAVLLTDLSGGEMGRGEPASEESNGMIRYFAWLPLALVLTAIFVGVTN